MSTQNRAAQRDTVNVDTSAAGLFSASGVFGSDNFGAASSAWENQLAADDGDNQDDHDASRREAEQPRSKQQEQEEPEEDDDDELDPDEDTEDDEDSDEGEDEDDSEDEDDEDNEQPAELSPDTKVKVKVDGEEVEVPLSELQNGYSRTQDYTRKTMELAEQRKQLETELQGWRDALNQVQTHIKAQQSTRTEAEWAALKQQDPYAYYEARDQERQLQERLEAVKQADQEAQQELQKRQQAEFEEYRKQQADLLLNTLSDWKDPAVAQKEQGEILSYGRELGLTDQELMSIVDHRHIRVLRDAAKYRQLQASQAKGKGEGKVKTRPKKTLQPGAKGQTPSNTKSTKRRKSAQRLQKTGSIQDASNFFESIL